MVSPMSRVNEIVSSQIGNYLTNKQTWSSIIYNVKAYGAKGDGTTDDAADIQEAFNAAELVGGTVWIPQGSTFLITSTLIVDGTIPVRIEGGGTLKLGANVPFLRFKNAAHSIQNISFVGTGRTDGRGVIIEGTAPKSSVLRCKFTDVPASAVEVQSGASLSRVEQNYMLNCGNGSAVVSPFNCTIYIADADECMVTNNIMDLCNWGVYFRGTTAISGYLCLGNKITAKNGLTGNQGISNQRGNSGRIIGNYVSGFNDNAIDMLGGRFMLVEGNSTINCKDGVFIGDESSESITINGNVFRSPTRGIRIYNTTAHNNQTLKNIIVTNNTIDGATEGGILATCTGTGSTMSRVILNNNTIDQEGVGLYGVKLEGGICCEINNNTINRSPREGIVVLATDICRIDQNIVQDASYGASNTYDAISVQTSNRSLLNGNVAYGTARYAAVISAGGGHTLIGTRWRSLGTGGVDTTVTTSDNASM
jgi:parallel beta-helix repeat protein